MNWSLTHSLFNCLNIDMAQIMNINAAPIVSPDGAYLVALKDGRISRIDGKVLSQDTEVKIYVDQKIEEITTEYFKTIATLEAKIAELKTIIDGLSVAPQEEATPVEATVESVEEAPKAKPKKSKK
jgi:hypothetical protein